MYLKDVLDIPLDINHEIILYYEEILDGKKQRLPHGIWEKPDAYFWAKLLVRYLLEEKLNLTVEELKTLNYSKTLVKFKLSGMYTKVFNSSPYNIVEKTYGRLFHEWEMKTVPMGFWQNKDNRIKAVKWLIEDQLKLKTKEEIRKKIRTRVIREYGLSGILTNVHNDDMYAMFNEAYPDIMRRWEFRQVGHDYWKDDENIKGALNWLIDEKLGVTIEWLKNNVSYTLLKENDLTGIIAELDYDYEKLLSFLDKER